MYRVVANIQSDGYIIETDAEITVTDAFGFLPIKVKNGDIDIQVKSENTVLEIDVFGYVTTKITAKELNSIGVAEMNPAVNVVANPLQTKSDNTVLYVIGAIATGTLLYYSTKKKSPKTVKL